MIRMIQSESAQHAKDYYTDALLKSDYYLNDQELSGAFRGKLAERLGIAGRVNREQFFALCENRHPVKNTQLTARTKENRTTGYDINFHCPKSVSLVHVLSKDDHILEAFHQSVKETMTDIEADSKARVRKGGKYADRGTGELIWADFIHQTARPANGHVPDPHLHAHCYVFNATWDEKEKQFKAGQFRDINRDMPYYQAMFHKRLSDKLMNLGYQIRVTEKSFEIEGVPKQVIDLFSKRTNEIGQVAKEKGITDAKALDRLGALTRAKKQKGLSMGDLQEEWRRQIQDFGGMEETTGGQPVRFAPSKDRKFLSPDKCVDHALNHCFERASVMPERRLMANGFKYSLGYKNLTVQDINNSFQNDRRIIRVRERGQLLCTTKEVLQEEKRMVGLAQRGRGKLRPLYAQAPAVKLKDQQAEAARHVLTSPDRVSIIRGAAGTGKTTLMKETVNWIEKSGHSVTVVAPTANASRGVLRDEGFAKAETVALFLSSPKMQEAVKGQVLWVDEAGLLGTKDMAKLLEVATQQDARLILGGDTRQHASVLRGDALRILNTVGGIRTAEVSRIYRQENENYRKAVEDLSKGDVLAGFQKLDAMGSVITINPLKPNEALVEDYLKILKKKKSGLVISPTHKQSEAVTDEIRKKMRQAGIIGKKEIAVESLNNLNMTQAEKADGRSFKEGQIIQFNQNMPTVKRGSQWSVKSATKNEVLLTNAEGRTITLPHQKPEYFDVFEKSKIGVSKGDKVKITRNGFDDDEKRLNNGQVLDVVSVSKSGKVKLRNATSNQNYSINEHFGHVTHAHCITSYAAQGKTVDEVLIAQPGATFGATDAKQFYVSVSRGKERARIYTDDKEALLDHAQEMGERQSAIELLNKDKNHLDHVLHLQREQKNYPSKQNQPEKEVLNKKTGIDKDQDYYEPGF